MGTDSVPLFYYESRYMKDLTMLANCLGEYYHKKGKKEKKQEANQERQIKSTKCKPLALDISQKQFSQIKGLCKTHETFYMHNFRGSGEICKSCKNIMQLENLTPCDMSAHACDFLSHCACL